jgi:hypothetical protein
MSTSTPQHRQGVAGPAETGRACPYCRFPLKEGVGMVQCGACGAAHHEDCFADNRGCAVVACTGGPDGSGAAPAFAGAPAAADPVTFVQPGAAPAPHPVAYAPPPMAPPPPQQPQWQQAPSPRRSSMPWVIGGAVALALAAAGSALAITLSSGDTPQNAAVPAPQVVTVTQESASPPAEEPEASGSSDTSSALDDQAEAIESSADASTVSKSSAESEIHDVLLEHHQAIVGGDYRGAWELMSTRKQNQKMREDGYDAWVAAQGSLTPHLDPSGLSVSIDDLDREHGVARVMVTGMDWNKSGARCNEWSGITWMKYENGEWRYDPGYSTTPQRERQWKNRFGELLGGSC